VPDLLLGLLLLLADSLLLLGLDDLLLHLLDGLHDGADPAAPPPVRGRAVGRRRHLLEQVAGKSKKGNYA
jgi:hypothetical protein